MTKQRFHRFIGIDWSGAEGEHQAGIRVAQYSHDTKRLELVKPPNRKNWSRQKVLKYIESLTDRQTLVGLDFGFSLPWRDELRGYLPEYFERIRDVHELWAFVDAICKGTQFFHAGPIWLSQESPFRSFIKYWSQALNYEGSLFNGGLLRKTEEAAKREGLRPISIYRMAGPQVGQGSFAGMRILRALDASSNPKIAIWPFEDIENAKVGVVEIYPAAFYRMAGRARPTKRQVLQGAHCQIISDTLQFFGSEYDANISDSIDAMDALISAAAICSISKQNHAFSVPNGKNDFAKEGWIFGIPFGGVA